MPFEKNGSLQKWHMTNTPTKNGALQKAHFVQ